MLAYRVEDLYRFHPPSAIEGHIPSPGGIWDVSPWDATTLGRCLAGRWRLVGLRLAGVMVAAGLAPPKNHGVPAWHGWC